MRPILSLNICSHLTVISDQNLKNLNFYKTYKMSEDFWQFCKLTVMCGKLLQNMLIGVLVLIDGKVLHYIAF